MNKVLQSAKTRDGNLPISLIDHGREGWTVSRMLPTGRRAVRPFGMYPPALEFFKLYAQPAPGVAA